MKVCFLTSTHLYSDDRNYHHMANSLINKECEVSIVSSKSEFYSNKDILVDSFDGQKLTKKEKINTFIAKLKVFAPDVIICSEPLTIYAAKKYDKNVRVVYDITEWYPSKKNLINHGILIRWIHYLKYFSFNLYSLFLADSFIFGEFYKSRMPRFLFPNKKHVFVSYYPHKKYITNTLPQLKETVLRLSYSGKISKEKGFLNFVNVVSALSKELPAYTIYVKIIGFYEARDKNICEQKLKELKSNTNVKVDEFGIQKFTDFIELISDTDIFLDLRKVDFENTHCLPIKLFYYMGLERPVIFSNLKAIKKEIDIEGAGYLVNPEKTEGIVRFIITYLKDKSLFLAHANNGRALFEEKYNWSKIELDFIQFIKKTGV